MKFAVVVFPGSNCDVDMRHAIADELGESVDYIWHEQADLTGYDAVLLPGGFSYGDYLRAGALAQFSNIMTALRQAVAEGKPVLGVCNGFQVLLEAGFLPGALQKNRDLKFVCRQVTLHVANHHTLFTHQYEKDTVITVPVAHGEGCYYCDDATLEDLQANQQIIFRYQGDNPNGSRADIAGIINKQGNVLGMMPHPERAVDQMLGSHDGLPLFRSILQSWRETHATVAT